MSPEEITAAINRDIYEDTWETQRHANVSFASRAPAEGLEKALFLCPACGRPGGIHTKGDAVFCDCGMRVTMDQRGFFREGRFSTIREWDIWQHQAFAGLSAEELPAELFPADGVLTDLASEGSKKIRFSLDLSRGAMIVNGENVPFSDVSDMAMVKTNRLLFARNGGYYEILSKNGILRPYLMAKQVFSREKGNE